MNKIDIHSILITTLKSYGAKKISVFGSFSRGENKPGSDLDILVEFSKKKSARNS